MHLKELHYILIQRMCGPAMYNRGASLQHEL